MMADNRMVVVDSSVWMAHLRTAEPSMKALLQQRKLLMHPFAVGEIMVGSFRDRVSVRAFLANVEQAVVVPNDLVLQQLEFWSAYSRGVGWIDMHLISSAYASHALLWTRDKRLAALAEQIGLRFVEP